MIFSNKLDMLQIDLALSALDLLKSLHRKQYSQPKCAYFLYRKWFASIIEFTVKSTAFKMDAQRNTVKSAINV